MFRSMPWPGRWPATVAVVAAAGTLVGCGSGSEESGGRVAARLFFAPATLDPQAASDIGARGLAPYAYDTPVALRDGKIVPQLASRWQVTPTSAKLWIKRDVTCSDGSDLTAREVADSVNRMKDPKTKAARTVTAFGSATGFSATANPADNTVTVRVQEPYGDLLYGMSLVYVICRPGLDDPAKLQTKTFGSGPYALTDVVVGDRYAYEARKGYAWGAGGPAKTDSGWPSGVDFKVIENETTATNQFLSGGLNLTMAQGPDRARLDGGDKATSTRSAAVDVYTMYLNHGAGRVTSNVNVRRLLSATVDRADFARTVAGKASEPPKTVILPGGLCYQPKEVGRALIPFGDGGRHASAAGYEHVDGRLMKDGKQLTVKVLIPDVFGSKAADFLAATWGDAGVKVDATVQPTPQAVETVNRPGSDWDVFLAGFIAQSPTELLQSFASPPPPDGRNLSQTTNAEFLRLATAAKRKLTESACDEWAAAERALYEQADVIPWAVAQAAWYGNGVTFEPWLLSAVHPESLRWAK